MNVIKQHVFEVVCSLVIVLALSSYFLWSYWDGLTQEASKARYERYKTVSGITKTDSKIWTTDLVIHGAIPAAAYDKKLEVYTSLKKGATAIAENVTRENSKNRLVRNEPSLPALVDKALELQPQPFLLPKIITTGPNRQDSHEFYQNFSTGYNQFLTYLVAGMPPVVEELGVAFDKEEQQHMPGHKAGAPVVAYTRDPMRFRLYEKNAVLTRATSIHIYADRNSFQTDLNVREGRAPDEMEIFTGFIYSWIQGDIVNSIYRVNENRNVERAPIKRLEGVAIGATAEGTSVIGSNLFASTPGAAPAPMLPTGVASSATGNGPLFISMLPAPAVPAGATAASDDGYKRVMTGRTTSELFDVTHVRVVLHMDPAAMDAFLSEMYKQNNAYTLIGVSMQAIDPLDSAANGYIYGASQTMRIELTFEAVFYRSWLEKLMPEGIRVAVGLSKGARPVSAP